MNTATRTTVTDISTHDLADIVDIRVSGPKGETETRYRGSPGGYLYVQAANGEYRQCYIRSPRTRKTDYAMVAMTVARARDGQSQRAALLAAAAQHLRATVRA